MLESRILQVFAKSGLSRTEFAERLNISNAVLSHISSGRNKASTELIIGILTQFPDISPDWLLFGKGEMNRDDGQSTWNQLKKDLLKELNQVLDRQTGTLETLKGLISKVEGLE